MEDKLKETLNKTLEIKVDDIAPNFRKRQKISDEQLQKIIDFIKVDLGIEHDERVLVGMMLLFLQGAASEGTPLTLSVQISPDKTLEKRNIIMACQAAEKHKYIRRIAESLAIPIGQFAYKNKLMGEFAKRINNKIKAETGETLTPLEMAYCSSFSQSIEDLESRTSSRLVKLLAEDYSRRFDNKKKESKNLENNRNIVNKKKKK